MVKTNNTFLVQTAFYLLKFFVFGQKGKHFERQKMKRCTVCFVSKERNSQTFGSATFFHVEVIPGFAKRLRRNSRREARGLLFNVGSTSGTSGSVHHSDWKEKCLPDCDIGMMKQVLRWARRGFCLCHYLCVSPNLHA